MPRFCSTFARVARLLPVRIDARDGTPADSQGSVVSATDPIAASPVYPAGSRVNEAGHLEVGRLRRGRARAPSTAPPPTSTPRTTSAPAPRAYVARVQRAHRPTSRSSTRARRCRRPRPTRCCARRASRSTSPPGASCTWRSPPASSPSGSTCTATTRPRRELRYAFDAGVGHLILDSFDEIERADRLLDRPQRRPDPDHARDQGLDPLLHPDRPGRLQVRVRPRRRRSPSARSSGSRDSKHLELVGLHAHIGSQIFELEPYVEGDRGARRLQPPVDLQPELLNVGGGLGIAYLDGDEPPSIEDYVDVKVAASSGSSTRCRGS